MDAVLACLKIRNQYAHCNWADSDPKAGLFFADLQESAKREDWFTSWKHVQHIPRWLNKDQKAQHMTRAQEAERAGAAQPTTRPPSVLRLTEEEWAAKRAKEAREGKHE
jgi:hypothetical protein